MAEKPRDPDFFGKAQIARTVFFGSIMGILALAMFIGLRENMGLALAMTIVFTTVAAVQWANGIQAQKEREPFFMNLRRSLTINPYIYLGALGGLALQIVAVYALSDWLYTVPLSLEHWLLVGLAFAIMFCVVEVRKWCEILLRRG